MVCGGPVVVGICLMGFCSGPMVGGYEFYGLVLGLGLFLFVILVVRG